MAAQPEAAAAASAELTTEGRTALALDPAMELALQAAIRQSREERNHKDAADSLGDLLKAACVPPPLAALGAPPRGALLCCPPCRRPACLALTFSSTRATTTTPRNAHPNCLLVCARGAAPSATASWRW